jgi:hypothetical protein
MFVGPNVTCACLFLDSYFSSNGMIRVDHVSDIAGSTMVVDCFLCLNSIAKYGMSLSVLGMAGESRSVVVGVVVLSTHCFFK